jgi:predicted dehydrogenase
MVAFSHRFFLANEAAKKAIAKGVIGKPFMIRVRYAHTGPYPGWAQTDWFYSKKKAGGGAMLDMGIHAIDMAQYLIGPVESVQAQVKTLRKNIQVDDNAVVLMDFGREAACLGYIEVGWTSPSGFAGIEVYGDKGSIRLELGKEGIINRGVNKPDGTIERREEVLKGFNALGHWPLQMETFIKYCLDKKTVVGVPGIEEGQSSLAVAIAAVESSETGKRVKVKRLK